MLQTVRKPVLGFYQCIWGAVNFAPHKCPTFLHVLKEVDDCIDETDIAFAITDVRSRA
jgi:hypothetical protein